MQLKLDLDLKSAFKTTLRLSEFQSD